MQNWEEYDRNGTIGDQNNMSGDGGKSFSERGEYCFRTKIYTPVERRSWRFSIHQKQIPVMTEAEQYYNRGTFLKYKIRCIINNPTVW